VTLSYGEAGHVASEGRMTVNGGKEEWRKPPSDVNTGLYNCHVGELKTVPLQFFKVLYYKLYCTGCSQSVKSVFPGLTIVFCSLTSDMQISGILFVGIKLYSQLGIFFML
jgi:hypothetical protein